MTEKKMSDIKLGQIVLFTDGEYSDFSHSGLCVSLKDFSLKAAKDEFKDWYINESDKDCFDGYTPSAFSFVTWLCSRQYMLIVDLTEVHLGSYGVLLDEDAYEWFEQREERLKNET